MTASVNSSPHRYQTRYQTQLAKVTIKDAEQIQGTPESQNREDAKPTLQNEFDKLMSSYYEILQATAGCGDRAQGSIDAAYGILSKFANEHPEFKAQLPQKYIARGDADGREGGFDVFGSTWC